MNNQQQPVQQTRGIGFIGLLTLVFITLKLTGYITWSWLWVLSPLWISLGLTLFLMLLFLLLVADAKRKLR